MAEETEGAGGASPSAGIDPAAIALALAQPGVLDPRAAAYLEEQTEILRMMKPDFEEEQRLKLSQLRLELHHLHLRRFSDYSKMALEIVFGLVLLIVVASFGVLIWNAAHANGLIIESFSVPPDLANRGLTGQALASQMLDKLIAMQNATQSDRPAQTYANNWGDDIKVQIPDTGISIGELSRFLRQW